MAPFRPPEPGATEGGRGRFLLLAGVILALYVGREALRPPWHWPCCAPSQPCPPPNG